MPVSIRVQADLGESQGALRAISRAIGSPGPLMAISGAILENNIRERFVYGRGPFGIPWPVSRRAARDGGRTLIDSGGIVNSLTHEATETRVEVGIIAKTRSAKFAYVHQFGATITPKNGPYLIFRGADGKLIFAKSVTIPARPFIGIDDLDRQELTEAWEDYLEGQAR